MALESFMVDTTIENKKIEFTLSFNRETTHWATSQPKKKGYCITVKPVIITQKVGYQMKEFGAFTGFYEIVYPCERKSAKRQKEAIEKVKSDMPKYLKFFILQGIDFPEENN